MLNVSQDFKNAINNDSRSVKAMVAVTFNERINMDNVTATATTYVSEETHPNKAINGRFNESDFIVTGDIPDRLKSAQHGWQSLREINPDGTLKPLNIQYNQVFDATDFANGQLTNLEVNNGALQLAQRGGIVDTFEYGQSPTTFRVVSGNWYVDYIPSGDAVFTHPSIYDNQSTTCVIEFDATAGPIQVNIDWGVSCEKNYDIFNITIDGQNLVTGTGNQNGTLSFFVESGKKQVTLKYTKDVSMSAGYDRAWLTKVEVIPATKVTEIDFSTISSVSGFSNPNWVLGYHYKAGKQVYKSPTITDNQITSNTYTINLSEPALLIYKIGVSSERYYDWFNVYIDGELWSAISGEKTQEYSVELSAGTHAIMFEYAKDESTTIGDDLGWIEYIKLYKTSASLADQGQCILDVTTPTMQIQPKQVILNWNDTENADYLIDVEVSFDNGANWVNVEKGGIIPFDYSQPWPTTFKLKIILRNGNNLPSPTWIPLEPGLIVPVDIEYKESTQLLSISLQYDCSTESGEELIVDYGTKIRTNNIWLVTGNTCIIENFSIHIYDPDTNNWSVLETVTGNTQKIWSKHDYNTMKFQKIKLVINKVAPGTSRIVVLQFGAISQLVFEQDDIVDLEILEELQAEGDAQLGSVIANECALTLRNDHRWFTPANENSPLAGLLMPKRLIEPYLGVEIAPNQYEFIPMGKFRSTDWNAPSSAVEASLTAYDRMVELNEMEIPLIPVLKNVTIKDLFAILFQKLGLSPTEYLIDQSLTQPVPLGWIPNGKVRDALPVLTEAGNCTVTIDRYDRIIVSSNFQNVNKPAEAKFTDNDHIIDIDNPQRFLDTYTHVKVSYKMPSLKNVQEILSIRDLTLPPGRTDLKNLQFQEAPVAIVTNVQLLESVNSSVIGFEYGAWGMNLSLQNNSDSSETVQLIIYGRPVDLISSSQIASNPEILMEGITEKYYEIDNPLIQSQNVAKVYSRAILEYLVDPRGNFKITVRGNPALEPRDIIEVESATDKIPLSRVSIVRNKIRFDGGLEIEIDGRKPAVPTYWVCLQPGLMIKAYQKINDDIYTS